ncbi:MAG: nuclear transport factor 2 family protein [Acidimicrobiales bacterium]
MDNDRAAIIEVLNRYADACDTRDWALFERVFTPDVTSDYGPGYQRADRAAIIASVQSHLGGCGPTQHLLANYDIHVDGDRAISSCRLRAYHCGTDAEPDLFYECFARYEDELARTADGWRITHRRMRVDFELGTRAVLKPLPTT